MLRWTFPLFSGRSHHTTPQFSVNTSSTQKTPLPPPTIFRIRHYAGCVTYSVHGFVEKNRDSLPKDISRAMYRCDHPMMQSLFPEGNPKRCAIKRPVSIAAQLQISLNALLKGLANRQVHYIRCMKPNELKQSKIFEMGLIQHQVRIFLERDQ